MAAFPTTRWSRILRVEEATGARAPDLEALARAYWRPVQAWLRAATGCAGDEADDAAQDFFVWVIERERFSRADPARGRFRAFLKTTLRHFAIDRDRRRRARKRGGGVEPAPLPEAGLPSREPAPDAALDAAFRSELVARAAERLGKELRGTGRGTMFAIFQDYFLGPDEGVDYRLLASRHGVTTAVVSNDLARAKRRFRDLLREEVAETVGDPAALEEEMRWLFGTVEP